MAAKNTISILETIKKKMRKFDSKAVKNEEAPKDAAPAIESGDEFDYIAPLKEASPLEKEAPQAGEDSSVQEEAKNDDLPKFEDDLGLEESPADALGKALGSDNPPVASLDSLASTNQPSNPPAPASTDSEDKLDFLSAPVKDESQLENKNPAVENLVPEGQKPTDFLVNKDSGNEAVADEDDDFFLEDHDDLGDHLETEEHNDDQLFKPEEELAHDDEPVQNEPAAFKSATTPLQEAVHDEGVADDDLFKDDDDSFEQGHAEILDSKDLFKKDNKPEAGDLDDFNFDDLEDDHEDFLALEKDQTKDLPNNSQKTEKKIDFDNLDDISIDELEQDINNDQKASDPSPTEPEEKESDPLAENEELESKESKQEEHSDIDLEFEKEFAPKDKGFEEKDGDVENVANNLTENNLEDDDFFKDSSHDDEDDFHQEENRSSGILNSNISKMPSHNNSGLINADTVHKTTQSIKKLVDAKSMIGGISSFTQSPALTEVAINLLEPKLEKWLNENLASMVEEIVQKEISKIIPKE